MVAVSSQRQWRRETPRGRQASGPQGPHRLPAPRGRDPTRCDPGGIAGADRRSTGAAWQCRDDLSCTPTAQAAGKKKSLHTAERDTERVQTLRTAFREAVEVLDVQRLKELVKNKFLISCAFGNGAVVPLGQVIVK